MSKVTHTAGRKADHIRINLEEDVQSGITTGLERLRFEHNATPELDLRQVSTELTFFDKHISAPLLISCMTGGTDEAKQINRALAEAAQESNIAMGLGSMRAAIEDASLAETFQVRQEAPDILLFANLGAVQLNYGFGPDECRKAVEMTGADSLVLHFNSLQEALQPEGDTDFSDLLRKIERVCASIQVPVVAKEVGWGFSAQSAVKLAEAGIAAIDVAGAGGTSWSQVEMHRAKTEAQALVAVSFRDWGIPTSESISQIKTALPDLPLIASGGLRNGVDIAKCIALGAELGGMASLYLQAAKQSATAVSEVIARLKKEIAAVMFATGSKDLRALHDQKLAETS
jgi:isopentenyl-diphosphate delta-isomerase